MFMLMMMKCIATTKSMVNKTQQSWSELKINVLCYCSFSLLKSLLVFFARDCVYFVTNYVFYFPRLMFLIASRAFWWTSTYSTFIPINKKFNLYFAEQNCCQIIFSSWTNSKLFIVNPSLNPFRAVAWRFCYAFPLSRSKHSSPVNHHIIHFIKVFTDQKIIPFHYQGYVIFFLQSSWVRPQCLR